MTSRDDMIAAAFAAEWIPFSRMAATGGAGPIALPVAKSPLELGAYREQAICFEFIGLLEQKGFA
jgi:hypothetical protein